MKKDRKTGLFSLLWGDRLRTRGRLGFGHTARFGSLRTGYRGRNGAAVVPDASIAAVVDVCTSGEYGAQQHQRESYCRKLFQIKHLQRVLPEKYFRK